MKAATNKGGSPLDPETKPGAASAWWVHGQPRLTHFGRAVSLF